MLKVNGIQVVPVLKKEEIKTTKQDLLLGSVHTLMVMEPNLHGKQVKHIRTGIIRKIFVLDGDDTPSGNGFKKGYNPITCILYDTYLTNIQFYTILQ